MNSLTETIKKELENMDVVGIKGECQVGNNKGMPMVYSPKLGQYVPLCSGKPKGEIQEYNIGLGPGSWY